MKKIFSSVCAIALAASSFGIAAAPASAAPLQTLQYNSGQAEFLTVQYRYRDRDDRGRFERRGSYGYYNGHRGFRDRRPGYRQFNGFWFPPAAFIFGAIVGGALDNQNGRNVRLSRQHFAWCEDRYRSYRASDNSFQPYNGPRQRCISPYMR
jgi:hypothetical protein